MGGVAFYAVSLLLDRRFRRHLSAPPQLLPEETREQKLLVLRFRAIGFGIFALTIVAAFFMYEAGSGP